jgi:peptide/nickel transport system substrate-binding protein/oligopeptide transport system substrate-binding protein
MKFFYKISILAVVLIRLACFYAAAEEPEYAEIRPRSSLRDELTVVFSKTELELDFRKSYFASEAQIYTAIYEGLFSYHPLTMEPIAAAASGWKVSDDKKEWTFTIRESAKFQNGDPVRAEDFRAAWLSLMEPGRDSPYSSLFDIIKGARDYRLGKIRANGVGISAPAEKTLVVQLNSPASFFPSMLCHHSFSPIHPSLLKKENWTDTVSNGPFYIDKINEDSIVLVKNPNYWDAGRVSLKKLTVKYSEDGDEAAAMWNSGAGRWIQGDVNYDALTDRSGIEVNAMFATYYYYVRSAREPWNDYRLRRALSLVLPWQEIRQGHSLPATTLIHPLSDYPKIDGLDKSNIEEALSLMAEANHPKGVGLPELVIRITPSQEAERIAGLMAKAWFEILNIPVKIDIVSFRQYYQSVKQNDYDVGYTTWIGDFADPYTFLQMWCRDSNLNDALHNDSDYEALIEKSMNEEGIKRWETLAEAETLLLSRGNVLPISYSPAVNVIDSNEIDGWYPNVLDIHPFKYMSIKARSPLPGVVMAR